ncbi:MAG: MFS transporter [Dehalococcoidia bacterium]|nr:MFS transporter [Dehalococcoidia bacterium]
MAVTPESPQAFRLRSLTWSVYLPTLLFAIGQGAVIPIIPLFAKDLGASVALASAIVAFRGFGTMAFDIPAGLLVGRVGERGAMVLATLALGVVAVGAALSHSVWAYAGLVVAMGAAWSIWLLARLSFVTEVAPVEQRGRALSLLGGANRVGNFVGPFAGGAAIWFAGNSSVFYVQAGLSGLACVCLFLFVKDDGRDRSAVHHGNVYQRLGQVVVSNRRVFLTAGLAATAIGILRASRQAVIPLWGDSIGLDGGHISLIFGISSALDMLLFYPVGIIMDRWGRKFAGVPCLLTMAVGMILIPLSGSFTTLLLASLLTSLGNGFGSGIVMTLGADFSPVIGRPDFLGVWRLVGDMGTAGGPALLGIVAGFASLSAASVAAGGLGLAGAAIMIFLMEEPLHRNKSKAAPVRAASP